MPWSESGTHNIAYNVTNKICKYRSELFTTNANLSVNGGAL